MSFQRWIFEWLSPNGVVAAGVVAGLVQQFYAKRAAVRAAGRAEQAAKVAAEQATKAVEQTNGMSHRLEQLAGIAGVAKGREEMRVEQAEAKAKE